MIAPRNSGLRSGLRLLKQATACGGRMIAPRNCLRPAIRMIAPRNWPAACDQDDRATKLPAVSNILLAYDMDRGQRYLEARKQRTKADFAQFWANLALGALAPARRIDVVLDNLNTHNYGSFYEHLPLGIAEQLRKKIRFVYTPKHGSWLNLAEIEFAALAGQCLDGRRIPSLEELDKEAQAWASARNVKSTRIYWSFTTAKAREKFQRHYDKLLKH